MKDPYPHLTKKGQQAMGGQIGANAPSTYGSPAPKPAPAPVAPPSSAASAPATPTQSRRFSYADAPVTIDYGDPNDPRKKNSHRRTLLAGDTGGYNPATGQQTLGMRSLLG